MANREYLVEVLELFDRHIVDIKEAIAAGDNELLLEIFTRAKTARDQFINKVKND